MWPIHLAKRQFVPFEGGVAPMAGRGLARAQDWRSFAPLMEDALLHVTADLLEQDWSLTLADAPSGRSWEQLRTVLAQHLAVMLADDFARLVNVMYRLDVPEQDFRTALAAPTLEVRAQALTDAVLARERLRAEMRIRYSSSSPAGPRAETNPI